MILRKFLVMGFGRSGAGAGLVQTFTKRSRTQGQCAFTTRVTGRRKLCIVRTIFGLATGRRLTRTGIFVGRLDSFGKRGVRVSNTCPIRIAGSIVRLLRGTRRGRVRRFSGICGTFTRRTRERKRVTITTSFGRVNRVRGRRTGHFGLFTGLLGRGGLFIDSAGYR